MESLVDLLRRAGLPKEGRSAMVRVALAELQLRVAAQRRADVVKYLLDRDVEWRRSRIEPPAAKEST